MFDHPEHIVAIHVVHHSDHGGTHSLAHTDPPGAFGPVWVIGALSVRRIGDSRVRFAEHHFVYKPDGHPHYPVRDVEALLTPEAHLLWCNEVAPGIPSAGYHEREADLLDETNYAFRRRRHHILQAPAKLVDAIAVENGIPVAHLCATLAEEARLAPDRAQAVWLMFLWRHTRDRDLRHALTKALHIWRGADHAHAVAS